MTRETPHHMFDPRKVWLQLSPELREEIGTAAVAMGASWYGLRYDGSGHGWEAALTAATGRTAFLLEGRLPTGKLPDLARLNVRACDGCGCTDATPCDGGCSWVGPHQCSRCEPALAVT